MIYRQQQREYLRNNVVINEGLPFVKINSELMSELASERLTSAECKVLFMCLKHINYGSGAVAYVNSGNFLISEDFERLTNLSRKTVARSIGRLVSLGVLSRGKTGRENQLYVNPFLFMKGASINDTLYKMFKNTKWNKGAKK